MRAVRTLPYQMFKSVKYSLRHNGYYGSTTGDRKYMHVAVWEYFNGLVPKGHEVHHVNKNKSDNHLVNLKLVTSAEHGKISGFRGNQYVRIK